MAVGLPAHVAIDALEPRRRLVAPSAIGEAFGDRIDRDIVLAAAILHRAAGPAVRADLGFERRTLIGKAILQLDADRAAERVEAEHRIGAPDVGAVDCAGRNQVPVDRVAKCFVEADAVDVDGETLRRALQRRSREAAIAKVLGKAVALDVLQIDAWHPLLERLGHRHRVCAGNVGRRHRVDHFGSFIDFDCGRCNPRGAPRPRPRPRRGGAACRHRGWSNNANCRQRRVGLCLHRVRRQQQKRGSNAPTHT